MAHSCQQNHSPSERIFSPLALAAFAVSPACHVALPAFASALTEQAISLLLSSDPFVAPLLAVSVSVLMADAFEFSLLVAIVPIQQGKSWSLLCAPVLVLPCP